MDIEIETVKIQKWSDFLKYDPEFSGWVYRGHADLNWKLETSLRRAVDLKNIKYGVNIPNLLYTERRSLKTFKSRAHFYLNDLPDAEDAVAWLSVMQHHGAPTRLLDFTRSIYIAIFFALADTISDACVWAIDENWLRTIGTEFAQSLGIKTSNTLRFGQLDSIFKVANLIVNQNNFDFDGDEEDFTHPDPAILMVDLERQFPRQSAQQGLFLAPTSMDFSFLENLAQMKPFDREHPIIMKFEINHELRDHFLLHLNSMNITSESLFPGIDGFARSLIQHY